MNVVCGCRKVQKYHWVWRITSLCIVLVAQLCPTLHPKNCSPPASSVHGILQAGILEWVAIPFSWDLPNPGVEPGSPALQVDSLWSEPPGKPILWRDKNLFEENCHFEVFPSLIAFWQPVPFLTPVSWVTHHISKPYPGGAVELFLSHNLKLVTV